MHLNKNFKYYIFYLLLAFVAYWQVGVFKNMLKWDMVDAYLPWRSYISECILNFHFPLWNPYQNFGYPIHADMRSIWSPEVWLISLLGGYSIYTFSVLFILYTSIAGLGMKFFSNLFLKNNKAAFYTGAIYMLSGYLTSHAQEMSTINSFAFLPIVLYTYFSFYNNVSIKRGVYFVLSIFVMLTSAYQAHSIILLYLLIVIFCYFTICLYQKRDFKLLKQFILYHIAFSIIIIIIFSPFIVSAYQVFPWVSRLNSGVNPLSVSKLLFSPQSLLSLILPFATLRNMEFFNTGSSMSNLYFGIIPLVFSIVYIAKSKKSSSFKLLIVFGLFSLIASFGDYTPLRKFLFDNIPLMNLFVGSAYFRLFTLIVLCIASGFLISNIKAYKNELLIVSILILTAVLIATVYGFMHIDFKAFTFTESNYSIVEILSDKSSFNENLFIQGIVQTIFLFLFIILLLKNKANYRNIVFLTLLNLVIAVQFNIYATAVSNNEPKKTNQFLKSLPYGFPIPDTSYISDNTDRSISSSPLWLNTNMLAKRISGDSFNSFILDKNAIFKDSLEFLKNQVTKNQLFYFSNNIKPLSELKKTTYSNNTLFINDSIYNASKHLACDNNLIDSHYKITNFEPNKIEVDLYAEKNTFLTLIQTYYKGWQVYVDKTPTEIIESNTMFMSVYLPKGKHKIVYVYQNNILINSFILSALVLFILIAIVGFFLYRDLRINNKIYLISFLLIVLAIFYKQYIYRTSELKFATLFEQSKNDNFTYLLDNSVEFQGVGVYELNFAKYYDITKLYNYLEKIDADTVLFAYKNKHIKAEYEAMLQIYFRQKEVLLDLGHSKLVKYSNRIKKQPYIFNNFELNTIDTSSSELSQSDTINKGYLNCKGKEYIASQSYKLSTIDKNKTVTAISEVIVKPEIPKNRTSFVFSIAKDGKNYYWAKKDLIDFYSGTEKETIFMNFLDLKNVNFPDGAELKILIWNRDKVDFNIDNYTIFIE